MLTTDDFSVYNFSDSPESSSTSDSFLTDTDIHSDEDFLQTLSADLDIPLLLNSNDDDLGLLRSCFDKSPDEILSELTPPGASVVYDFNKEFDELQHIDYTQWASDMFPNLKSDVKLEENESAGSSIHGEMTPPRSNDFDYIQKNADLKLDDVKIEKLEKEFHTPERYIKSDSPTPSVSSVVSTKGVKEEIIIDTPPVSPNSNEKVPYDISLINEHIPKLNTHNIKILPHDSKNKVILKKISIPAKNKNKTSPVTFTNEIIPTKQAKLVSSTGKSIAANASNVVILENIKTVPISTITSIPQITTIPVTTTTTSNGFISMPIVFNDNKMGIHSNIDLRLLKRQQRMIKNRESANLSRKKKKDYLLSLEKKVMELSEENDRLKVENTKLKDTLVQHGFNISSLLKDTPSAVTKTLILCMVVFTIGFNMDFIRGPADKNPFLSKTQKGALPQLSDHHGRQLLWSADPEDEISNITNVNTNPNQNLPMCPIYVNQSENARIALELHRWIGKPYNMTEEFRKQDLAHEKQYKIRKSRNRKVKAKYNSVESPIVSSVYKLDRKFKRISQMTSNELQLFTPNIDHIYTDFFEAINRRDDTFYVVSFSADHMLLPALNYNKTSRPKMSLIMPSVISNDSTQDHLVPLMQIDCEVLNTRLIHVKHAAIPQHFRSTNQTQSSYKHPDDIREKPAQNYTEKTYTPYFMKNVKSKVGRKAIYLDSTQSDFEPETR